MKHYAYLLLPPAALLFQALPPLWLRLMPAWFYGDAVALSPAIERPMTLIGLFLSALISLGLANTAIYTLLRKAPFWLAILLIALCCIPALIGGMIYLHGLLVFLALY